MHFLPKAPKESHVIPNNIFAAGVLNPGCRVRLNAAIQNSHLGSDSHHHLPIRLNDN